MKLVHALHLAAGRQLRQFSALPPADVARRRACRRLTSISADARKIRLPLIPKPGSPAGFGVAVSVTGMRTLTRLFQRSPGRLLQPCRFSR